MSAPQAREKIAIVLKGYPRLSETFIAQEIRLLERAGFALEIFSLRQARETERHPVVREISAPVTYLPEYLRDAPLALLWAFGKQAFTNARRFWPAAGHALTEAWRRREKAPLKRFLQASWLVEHRLRADSPVGHLHSHFLHAPTELTFYASRLSGRSYSISAHAKDIYTTDNAAIRERIVNSEFLMTCTKFNSHYLKSVSDDCCDKVNRVYHGIDTDRFQPGPKPYSQSGNRFRLVTCARLVAKKGFPVILEAIAGLARSGIPVTYDVYGTGELQAELAAQAAALGIADRVHWHGNVTQDQVIGAYREQGVFVLACQELANGDRDGIPNSLAEAMSMGMPVVATDISGIPELVEDGVSGLLVPSRDSSALLSALYRILQDAALGDRLGAAGRERVRAVFDSHNCVQTCAELLTPYQTRTIHAHRLLRAAQAAVASQSVG